MLIHLRCYFIVHWLLNIKIINRDYSEHCVYGKHRTAQTISLLSKVSKFVDGTVKCNCFIQIQLQLQ
jgi:hypothetical protein